MKRSNRLVILVGVLLAVLAFVGIVIVLNSQEEAVPPEETTVEVTGTATAIHRRRAKTRSAWE